MPLLLISCPIQPDSDSEQQSLPGLNQSQRDGSITCLFSFLSAPEGKRFYVCNVDDPEAIEQELKDADVIMEVSEILPGTVSDGTLRSIFSDILHRYQ